MKTRNRQNTTNNFESDSKDIESIVTKLETTKLIP